MIRSHVCNHCNKTNILDLREVKEHKITYSRDGMDTEIELSVQKIDIEDSYKPKEFMNQLCRELKDIDKIKHKDFFRQLNHRYRINEDLWNPVINALKKRLGAYEKGEYLVIP